MPNMTDRTLNRLLWTAQILVALIFLFAGSMKFIMPAGKMQQGGVDLSIPFIHFIGVCEILGAVGLLLPGLTGIATVLTPLAAAGLTVIMIGAVVVSVPAMGPAAAILPAIVGVTTAWITYGRFRRLPLVTSRRALAGA